MRRFNRTTRGIIDISIANGVGRVIAFLDGHVANAERDCSTDLWVQFRVAVHVATIVATVWDSGTGDCENKAKRLERAANKPKEMV